MLLTEVKISIRLCFVSLMICGERPITGRILPAVFVPILPFSYSADLPAAVLLETGFGVP